MADVRITDLDPDNAEQVRQTADVLLAAFHDTPDAWPDMAAALDEVRESCEAERISRVALDPAGNVLGWVGGIQQYSHAWELHPLAVHPRRQGRGIGAALVADLEALVRARGAHTLYLGTDDENGRTSLSSAALFPDPWPHIAAMRNPGRHPYAFYLKQGFHIVGVIPDANGPGKPDILMAKPVR